MVNDELESMRGALQTEMAAWDSLNDELKHAEEMLVAVTKERDELRTQVGALQSNHMANGAIHGSEMKTLRAELARTMKERAEVFAAIEKIEAVLGYAPDRATRFTQTLANRLESATKVLIGRKTEVSRP